MGNRSVTRDMSDVVIAAAALAGFFLNKRDRLIEAHDTAHDKVVVKGSYGIPLQVGTAWFLVDTDTDVSTALDLDTGTIEGGKDYYVYACNTSGALSFVLSLNATYPSGFTADTSRKIGGFHTLCVSAGTISGHSLTGYAAGEILPASIWDLKHRPHRELPGMFYDPGRRGWYTIYLLSDDGASGVQSVYGAAILDNINWMDMNDRLSNVGMTMCDDAEFQSIAAGSNEETNIFGSADPVTTGGHTDTAGRRMISHLGAEDCCGAMWQWLRDQSYRFDGGATSLVAASETLSVIHDGTPGGNQLYLCYDAAGVPYLACNMASATADKVLTFGSLYKVVVKHEASPSGMAIYFDDDATQPGRLLANNTVTGKNEHIRTNDPEHYVRIVHDASASSNGSALTYDDSGDDRLECNCAGAANAVIDLAELSFVDPTFAYYDLPGSKGSLYTQGTYGDVKLRAGGFWNDGSSCGSRTRNAYYSRWHTNSTIGGRGRAEPL